jgi:hypothetical protein
LGSAGLGTVAGGAGLGAVDRPSSGRTMGDAATASMRVDGGVRQSSLKGSSQPAAKRMTVPQTAPWAKRQSDLTG